MEKLLFHRGPDDGECWVAQSGLVGLVHRRLSILDLSAAGHQPMHTVDGRYSIVFNGEIYNFKELRDELSKAGVRFRSHGDTEVILELFVRHGPSFVSLLLGMFAIAIWDNDHRELFLARDSMGIKPLYVWERNGRLAFGSELRAVLAADLGPHRVDGQAVAGFLLMGSVQEPRTMVQNVSMLPAGHTLTWSNGNSVLNRFWKIDFPHASTKSEETDRGEYLTLLRDALTNTIHRHFVSDVPVGIFLSGGIDSTALVAMAGNAGYQKLNTFSIAFEDSAINEGALAKKTAVHFGTEHHEWLMKADDGQSLFESFIDAMDQPSNDGFNTYCVSKFAHDQGIKVVLSGLGGDELFGGYPSFARIPKMLAWHDKLGKWPGLRAAIPALINQITSTGRYARIAEFLRSTGGTRSAYCAMRGSFTPDETERIVAHYTGESVSRLRWNEQIEALPSWSILDQISFLELTHYMRNQLLRDSDVMSMAWGLELRVPFVDSALVENVSSIPHSIRLATGKRLLVDAVGNIPQWVVEQPKRGFSFPFQQWMTTSKTWRSTFASTLERCPVKPRTWYQQWMLFVLEKSLQRLN